jgi:hypothetical protein
MWIGSKYACPLSPRPMTKLLHSRRGMSTATGLAAAPSCLLSNIVIAVAVPRVLSHAQPRSTALIRVLEQRDQLGARDQPPALLIR